MGGGGSTYILTYLRFWSAETAARRSFMNTVTNEIDEHGSLDVKLNGIRLACITKQTLETAKRRFVEEVERDKDVLAPLVEEAEAKRQWNYASDGKGQNWPIFRTVEKRIDALCKEAGIKDL